MLTDVADVLIAGDRSAAAIMDDEGELLGVITENDMVQAYAEGMEYNYMVTAGVWLRGGRARFPSTLAPEMTVAMETPLCVAAEKMRIHALGGDSAWRHLIVRDEHGALRGILSSLDLARALCSGSGEMAEVNRRIGGTTAAEVMKPRATLPTCPSTGAMEQALKAMLRTHQNCVLIIDAFTGSPQPVGIVTPRDALRAFAEHVRLDVSVGHWLRGLRSALEPRVVRPDAALADAGRIMASNSIHHLVVVQPDSQEIVGVVSSSDLAQAMGSAERVVVDCRPSDA